MAYALDGALVLVFEDEHAILDATMRVLTVFGCRVLGPTSTITDALQLLDREWPDALKLDATLDEDESFLIAGMLLDSGIPYAFLTSRSGNEIPSAYEHCRLLGKPFSELALRAEVLALLILPNGIPRPAKRDIATA